MGNDLRFFQIAQLRQRHPAWRLLNAQHAPLIISFLHRSFIAKDRRSLAFPEAVSLLEDYLHELRASLREDGPARTAKEYIGQWSGGDTPFLTLRYGKNSQIPEVDLTAGAEKAIRWVEEQLEGRTFVGTESRLLAIFRLMEDLVQHTETDREKVLERLRQKKAEVEEDIRRAEQGELITHDSTQIKERFFQLEDTVRQLLGDFRQVEETFRDLDRRTRERAVSGDDGKGKFLDEVFGQHDAISDSDQGRSFQAFWDLLLRGDTREEFHLLLEHLRKLQERQGLSPSASIHGFLDSLLLAGDKIKRVTNQLTAQLRKYLDDRALLESRRVMELVQSIEKKAALFGAAIPKGNFAYLDELRPELSLDLSRPLFDVESDRAIESRPDEAGESEQRLVPLARLFEAQGVDEERLKQNIERWMGSSGQVPLRDILAAAPLEKGLAELVTYLKIASERKNSIFNPHAREVVTYRGPDGKEKQAELEQVIFSRTTHNGGTHGN